MLKQIAVLVLAIGTAAAAFSVGLAVMFEEPVSAQNFQKTTEHTLRVTHEARFGGVFALSPTTQALPTTFTLSARAPVMWLSSDEPVTSDTTKAIEDGRILGQELLLKNTNASDSITVKDGANTDLGSDVTLGASDLPGLIWDGVDWDKLLVADN